MKFDTYTQWLERKVSHNIVFYMFSLLLHFFLNIQSPNWVYF